MPPPAPASPPSSPSTLRTVLAGVVALAVAMGIGRFAFTPLLPLMQRDGVLDASTGAEWAAANYVGYLAGALLAGQSGRFGIAPLRLLQAGLAGVVACTWLGAWTEQRLAGALLRGLAGVGSAWVLIGVSSWCLAELARRGAAALGAWVYCGVGIGITAAGALAWLGGAQPAERLWLELGLLALAGALFVQGTLPPGPQPKTEAVAAPGSGSPPPRRLALVLCYGGLGFGYIVPATFLPAMARAQVDDPLLFGITWPLFGLAAALSVAVAARVFAAVPRRRVWAGAHAVMALGTALPLASPSLAALAASALLVGGTFMVGTMAGLQWARELAPQQGTSLLAGMTSAFAAGQILGPLAVRAFGPQRWAGWDGVQWACAAATAVLALSAAWLALARRGAAVPQA